MHGSIREHISQIFFIGVLSIKPAPGNHVSTGFDSGSGCTAGSPLAYPEFPGDVHPSGFVYRKLPVQAGASHNGEHPSACGAVTSYQFQDHILSAVADGSQPGSASGFKDLEVVPFNVLKGRGYVLQPVEAHPAVVCAVNVEGALLHAEVDVIPHCADKTGDVGFAALQVDVYFSIRGLDDSADDLLSLDGQAYNPVSHDVPIDGDGGAEKPWILQSRRQVIRPGQAGGAEVQSTVSGGGKVGIFGDDDYRWVLHGMEHHMAVGLAGDLLGQLIHGLLPAGWIGLLDFVHRLACAEDGIRKTACRFPHLDAVIPLCDGIVDNLHHLGGELEVVPLIPHGHRVAQPHILYAFDGVAFPLAVQVQIAQCDTVGGFGVLIFQPVCSKLLQLLHAGGGFKLPGAVQGGDPVIAQGAVRHRHRVIRHDHAGGAIVVLLLVVGQHSGDHTGVIRHGVDVGEVFSVGDEHASVASGGLPPMHVPAVKDKLPTVYIQQASFHAPQNRAAGGWHL